MSVKFDNDGKVVQDTIKGKAANPVSDLYQTVGKELPNIAEGVVEGLEEELGVSDEDAEKWAKTLRNLTVNDGFSLGDLQHYATNIRIQDYPNFGGYVQMTDPTDDEQEAIQKGDLLNYTKNSTYFESPEEINVPTTPDGEALPVIVLTNETNKGCPTYDEALPILKDVISHIDGVEMDEPDIEASDSNDNGNTSNNSPSSESEREDASPAGFIHGIGDSTMENVDDSAFELVATRFPNKGEWDTSFEESAYYVESEWDDVNEDKEDYLEVEDVVTFEGSKGDLWRRFGKIEDGLPSNISQLIENLIGSGKLVAAHETIESYE